MGKPEETKPTMFHLPVRITKALKHEAVDRGLTVSALAAKLLDKALGTKAAAS